MRYRVGRTIVEITDFPLRMAIAVASSGVFAGLLEYGVHSAVTRATSEVVQAVVDATIVALAGAIIALLALLGIRERHRRVLGDIRKIAELNHHIRNALQVVVHSQYVPPSEEQRKAVLTSVDRIDNTLRELFPVIGEREDEHGIAARKEYGPRLMVPNRRR